MPDPADWLARRQRAGRLPQGLLDTALRHYLPLAERLAARRGAAERPLVAGVHGCQGSGKSTLVALLADWLREAHGLRVATLSLDDGYLTRAERLRLAERVHPLLRTRGVPGTHDTALLGDTLDRLISETGAVPLPRFDKPADDRLPAARWPRVAAPVDLVLFEGWCLGVPPQSEAALARPCNRLEAEEDADGRWRRHVNDRLRHDYPPLWARIDHWVMLAAPGFECVFDWRMQAERAMARQAPAGARLMDETAMRRFLWHYQRLTEHALAVLPGRVDDLFRLDRERRVIEAVQRAPGHSRASGRA